MIKRKVNNNHAFNSTVDDTDLSDIFKDEKELRHLSKKGLEEIYSNLLKNIDDLTKRQSELEGKVESLTKKNEDHVTKNKVMSEDLANKK
jgi:hypothetical protein